MFDNIFRSRFVRKHVSLGRYLVNGGPVLGNDEGIDLLPDVANKKFPTHCVAHSGRQVGGIIPGIFPGSSRNTVTTR